MNHLLRILDICSGAGLAAIGYHQSGWSVTGVDIAPQPRYPFEFIQADALEVLADLNYCRQFDAIHASPPCQKHSNATAQFRKKGKDYTDIISAVRNRLETIGRPYVMENVPSAPIRPDIVLVGWMFGELRVVKKRHFEIFNWWAMQPGISQKIGTVADGDYVSIFGKFGYQKNKKWPRDWRPKFAKKTGLETWHFAMGIPREYKFKDIEISQGIPPAYTRYIGSLLAEHIQRSTLKI